MKYKRTTTIELSDEDCRTLYKVLGSIRTTDYYNMYHLSPDEYLKTIDKILPILCEGEE